MGKQGLCWGRSDGDGKSSAERKDRAKMPEGKAYSWLLTSDSSRPFWCRRSQERKIYILILS